MKELKELHKKDPTTGGLQWLMERRCYRGLSVSILAVSFSR